MPALGSPRILHIPPLLLTSKSGREPDPFLKVLVTAPGLGDISRVAYLNKPVSNAYVGLSVAKERKMSAMNVILKSMNIKVFILFIHTRFI